MVAWVQTDKNNRKMNEKVLFKRFHEMTQFMREPRLVLKITHKVMFYIFFSKIQVVSVEQHMYSVETE